MNRLLQLLVFLAGLAGIAWVGGGDVGANPLALAVTGLIAALYGTGTLELRRFARDTARLDQALAALDPPPPALTPWLDGLPASLRSAVRRRVEGLPAALPGPALAPYLAGLLVLLGMLGTFLGMVLTLRGTGTALALSTDLTAVRDALVAPVKGLGLAFGTSIAGVAGSAALGLLSALLRHDRLGVVQRLDACIAGPLHGFSAAAQREASLRLQQQQTALMSELMPALMPALVDRLQALAEGLDRRSQATQDMLLAGQADFHARAQAAYSGLAVSVERSLQQSLARALEESARATSATLAPVVDRTLGGIAHEAQALQQQLAGAVQQQLAQLGQGFEASGARAAQGWQTVLAEQVRTNRAQTEALGQALLAFGHQFEQRAGALVTALAEQQRQAQQDLLVAAGERDASRLATLTTALEGASGRLQQHWAEAGAHSLARQQRLCDTLEQTARQITTQAEAQVRSTAAEVERLVETAAQAPRAAAEVMAELRQQLSASMARDHAQLDERARLLGTLDTLLAGVTQAAHAQRGAVDALVESSARTLEAAVTRFGHTLAAQSQPLAEVAAQLTDGAVEVASLGEAFGQAVQLFTQSSGQLATQLERIEAALGQSLARSDEQLAYYVAQAREVIDLSLLSQKQILDDLQRMAAPPARAGEPAQGAAA